jgi:hypothetical protein
LRLRRNSPNGKLLRLFDFDQRVANLARHRSRA